MAEPDLDALRRFSELPDREATPYFGGRTEEIGLVERALQRIRERAREGHWRPGGGETFLFQGAPGAGKSALLHHLVRRWRNAGREAPVVVDTEASHYVDESALALHVTEALDPRLAAQFRHAVMTHSSTTRSLRGGIPGLATGNAATETGRHAASTPAKPTLTAVKEALLNSRRLVVVILDEAQDLEGFDADLVRSTISELHKGSHGGPILAIFAGLAHSDTVLQNRGISRMSVDHDRTLAALSFDEAVETVHLMFGECRVRGNEETRRQWADALAHESSGWPQHLQVAMRALAAQLLLTSDPGQLEPVDSNFGVAVLKASQRARELYYERRIDPLLADALHLVAETMRRIGKAATRDAVLRFIRATAQPGEGSSSLPQEFNAQKFLDHMIRRGVLQRAPGQMLACPIPSLRGYIERIANFDAPET